MINKLEINKREDYVLQVKINELIDHVNMLLGAHPKLNNEQQRNAERIPPPASK